MSLDRGIIGRESPTETFLVTAEDIRQFAEAIGDPNPLYHDEAMAGRSLYGGLIAPPTFPTRFRQAIDLGLDRRRTLILHGEQEYRYTRPIRAGDAITCRSRVVDVVTKEGRQGPMMLLIIETSGEDARGQPVFHGRSTAIVRQVPGK
jgi:acyl dehydratase